MLTARWIVVQVEGQRCCQFYLSAEDEPRGRCIHIQKYNATDRQDPSHSFNSLVAMAT